MNWRAERDRRAIQSASLAFVSALLIVTAAMGLLEVMTPAPGPTEASQTSTSTRAITTLTIAFPSSSSSSTSSNAITPGNQPFLFKSGVSPFGLELEMGVNSTTMRVNGSISGGVSVVNTLAANVTVDVPAPSQNMTSWSNSIHICPSADFLGYGVFDGHFVAQNISLAGQPLVLVPPMMMSCPIPYYVPGQITFLSPAGSSGQTVVYAQQPSSRVEDQLAVTTKFCNTTFSGKESGGSAFSCSWATPGLVGYWEGDSGGDFGFTSPGFAQLPPGVYTIMAWDVWDQCAFARITVTGAGT